ncbi:MAG: TIGR00282 family metallophosphoesterase [Clostridia bacterium]|nr:TIGR00282 family metallophosphoesterase [Clostridia bacterium]
MNILVIGDVVSSKGCEFLRSALPSFKKVKGIDLCIANGENSAVGNGITPFSAQYLFDSGVDFLTTGNHVFRRREMYDMLDESDYIIRPANFNKNNPGKGYAVIDMGFVRVGVINLMGNVYMDRCDNPFAVVDEILPKLSDCRIILVDFHAEATAEKKALGYYLDGRVSAVFGTHTHVMTADATIMPKGTAYITDIGMTGPKVSVLGVKPEISIEWLKTSMPARFDTAEGDCIMNGCIFEIDNKTGKVINIEPVTIE